jgi:MoaA/NifB/PqqE/SkfB family radical SAM enzyme
MIRWDHWHIEPSSICALKCPRCPRAEVPESLLNRQLTLDFFKNQVGKDVARQIRKITFCGNDGDPVYCRDLVEIIIWFKTLNPEIQIVVITNGSYKPVHWWEYLGKALNKHDEIHWSLDGWDEHSNLQYRIQSDWISIMRGIETFQKVNDSTYCVWAAIAFRFNQHQIEHMKTQANTLGFDCFQLTKSTKFGSKYPSAYGTEDLLEPTDPALVASAHRFERVITPLTSKARPGAELKIEFLKRATQLGNHSGICLIGSKGVFLNSRGEFYPCCWTANRYPHNDSWQGRFNLNTKTFAEIIADPFWTGEFLQFDNLECQTKCTPERLQDPAHTSEW